MSVCASFFICWAPFHFQRLLAKYSIPKQEEDAVLEESISKKWNPIKCSDPNYVKDFQTEKSNLSHDIQLYIFFIVGILYYFTATLNPILYNIMSKHFRNTYKRKLLKFIILIRKLMFCKTCLGNSPPISSNHSRKSSTLNSRICNSNIKRK